MDYRCSRSVAETNLCPVLGNTWRNSKFHRSLSTHICHLIISLIDTICLRLQVLHTDSPTRTRFTDKICHVVQAIGLAHYARLPTVFNSPLGK